MDINFYLEEMVSLKASDLHIKVAESPVYRVDGALHKNGYPQCYIPRMSKRHF